GLHILQQAREFADGANVQGASFVFAFDDYEKVILRHAGANCYVQLAVCLRLAPDYSVIKSDCRTRRSKLGVHLVYELLESLPFGLWHVLATPADGISSVTM